MDFQTLKARHRLERDTHHVNLTLRVHRSLSWLQRAEQADDADGRFVFLWIAFNAAYATDIDENYRLSEQETFRAFLRKLCDLDQGRQIEKLVWSEFSGSIRVLLDNQSFFRVSGITRMARSANSNGPSVLPMADAERRQRWHSAIPLKCSRCCSIESTPCVIRSCTAVRPGTAASIDLSCATAAICSASWSRWSLS